MCNVKYVLYINDEAVPLNKFEKIHIKRCQLERCLPENAMDDVFLVSHTDQGIEVTLLEEKGFEDVYICKYLSLDEKLSLTLSEFDEFWVSSERMHRVSVKKNNEAVFITSESGGTRIERKIALNSAKILSEEELSVEDDIGISSSKKYGMLFSFGKYLNLTDVDAVLAPTDVETPTVQGW